MITDKSEVSISVKDLHKTFRLPHEQHSGIKQRVVGLFQKNRKKGYENQHVLKGVSFEVAKGDFFGIVGRNGSGKSTLLKLLAGIYTPDSGSISISGSTVPFIELGVGFNPELTGRENIFLNGALLGFSRQEMQSMYDEIVDFAELEKFMDQKLKNYSSGMQVRLAFSIAIKAQGDVLILDEVLAVGDEAFQRKCDDFFNQIKKDKTKTVVLVTHSMGSVKKYCNKAILIKDGELLISGDPNDVANQYVEENLSTDESVKKEKKGQFKTGLNERVTLLKNTAISKKVVSSSENFRFKIEYNYEGDKKIYAALSIVDIQRGGVVYDSGAIDAYGGRHDMAFEVPLKIFNSGNFKIMTSLRVDDIKNSRKTNMIAFTNESNSLVFSIRNENEKSNYALLNRDEFNVKQV